MADVWVVAGVADAADVGVAGGAGVEGGAAECEADGFGAGSPLVLFLGTSANEMDATPTVATEARRMNKLRIGIPNRGEWRSNQATKPAHPTTTRMLRAAFGAPTLAPSRWSRGMLRPPR